MEHGQKWIHATDVCQVCSCEEGITKCERMECEVPCTHPVMKPNHCCPECNGINSFIYNTLFGIFRNLKKTSFFSYSVIVITNFNELRMNMIKSNTSE